MTPHPIKLKWIAAALLIIGSGAAGYFLAAGLRHKPPIDSAPPPVLVLAPGSRTLEALREGEVTTRKLTIENQGEQEVRITRFHGDCRCATFRPNAVTIPAGGKAEVEVEVRFDQSATHRKTVELLVLADAVETRTGQNVSAHWHLTGRIVRDVHFSPERLSFGEVVENKIASAKQGLRITSTRTIESVTPEFSTTQFTLDVVRPVKDGFEVTVRPRHPPVAGATQSAMNIKVKMEAGPELRFAVPVSIHVLPEIEVIPERLLGGRLKVGTKVREEVVLVARSGKALKVIAMGSDRPALDVNSRAEKHRAGVRLQIGYAVTRDGFDEMQVWADVQQEGRDDAIRVTVPVQVTGFARSGTESRSKP